MTTFWTSDLHFGHAKIIEYCNRPFGSVDEMNEILIRNWNETVAPDDVVWVLGDVAMGKIAETLPLVSRLNGVLLLVTGNHDRCWWAHHQKDVRKWTPRYEEVGFTVFNVRERVRLSSVSEPTIKMSHFPYEGDSTYDQRYLFARPTDDGHVLFHGHVHDAWKINKASSGSVQVNVGCDVWDYRPVSTDELLNLI